VNGTARRERLARARLYLVLDGGDDAVLEPALRVGQGDATLEKARRAVGSDRLVGLSASPPEELDAEPDYFGVGAVFGTPTKADAVTGGLELVRAAAGRFTIPWFAIGGIDLSNVAQVVAAGAPGVAVVRAIRDADDPEEAARRLKLHVA
jgi:thiamine-phosphate pyrophosphorylase